VNSQQVLLLLKRQANPDIATHSQRFFKTAEGEYAYGDVFWGIRVPVLRQLVKSIVELELEEIRILLTSLVHEVRLFALLLLVKQYQQAEQTSKQQIFDCYLAHTAHINNWDLVDSSAHLILGPHLQTQSRSVLYQLAESNSWWERRIAIMATFHFIKINDFTDTLKIATILLLDQHDLIHKAVGWMLREVGNRDKEVELNFLTRHYQQMPRTMLRYAIEKFPEPQRQAFLHNKVISN